MIFVFLGCKNTSFLAHYLRMFPKIINFAPQNSPVTGFEHSKINISRIFLEPFSST